MKVLKLFLEDFDPEIGRVTYSVENEDGDRVGRGQHTDVDLKNYSPATMDFFVLAFLPQLRNLGFSLQVQGPISESLAKFLKDDAVQAGFVVEGTEREYKKEDIEFFEKVFSKTHDLNKTLSGVFNYFK